PTARPRLLIVLLGGEDGSGATSDDARSSRFSAARLRGCSRHARSRLARSTAPSFWAQLNAKRLEMLKEACPRMSSNLESQLPAVRDRDSAVVRRGSRRGVRARQVAFASALYPTACSFLARRPSRRPGRAGRSVGLRQAIVSARGVSHLFQFQF